jgi:hypothetical protein
MLALTDVQKRIALFLTLCMGSRVGLVFLAKLTTSVRVLQVMGVLALCVSLGFLLIFLFKLRETGRETYGAKIWWNSLRPFHAFTYALFAYFALVGPTQHAWKVLLVDVLVGFLGFTYHHLTHSS